MQPLVTILTPVYNGEKYLEECIESVLNQSYTNWKYIIVNNCSSDRTLEIATKYAEHDNRLRIINNKKFVDVIDNHNIAFKLVSNESKYCKVVSADDWIYPECVERMVENAEKYPKNGMIGCYSISKNGVHLINLPLHTTCISGQEACRKQLLGSYIFKPPSSLLYRADLIRSVDPYYAVSTINADLDTFFRDMQHSDYGCVHQILNFERIHDEAITSKMQKYNSMLVDRLDFLIKYGFIYLTQEEREMRMKLLLDEYYEYLAERKIHFVDNQFWDYQKSRLNGLGFQIDKLRLAKTVLYKCFDLLFNPKQTIERIIRRLNID